jgi:A/G-specific adenine glycosylase
VARKRPELDPRLAKRLLAWFDRRGRKLPWRTKGKRDPYRVWLTEIMLQQTAINAAIPYLRVFLKKWPNVAALARAKPESVLKAWAGLGYYARARNLHRAARIVARDLGGRFPETAAGLRALPGIGPYTASAIAAIAFGQREAAIDGNVLRVLARVLASHSPAPHFRQQAEAALKPIVPKQRAGDFAEALMDLGATVCRPKNPACPICPWQRSCCAFAQGRTTDYPMRPAKKAKPRKRTTVYWIEKDGAVLVRRRPDKGLLGGMLELPSSPWRDGNARRPFAADWKRIPGTVRHAFSHFELDLRIEAASVPTTPRMKGAFWMQKRRLLGAGFPSVMVKAIRKALAASP